MNLTGKITLLKRWIGILLGRNSVAIQQSEGKFYSKTGIAGYYNDLTGKVNEKTLLDKNGIPVNLIVGNKKVYFPISIFQYALGLWDLYIETGKEKYREHFLLIAKWALENQQKNGAWNCFEPIGYKNLTVSSMGQGEGISVLLRAYKLTNEKIFVERAHEAVKFMILPINMGGTLRIECNNYIFEEYADIKGVKKSVLNGWIFSLFGIYDYIKCRDDEYIKNIYNKSIKSLKNNIIKYDMGYWSYYDRSGHISSPAYHDLHISLLKTIADITNDKYFFLVAKKWEKYRSSKGKVLIAIIKKAIQKLKENPEGIIIQ